MDRRAFITVAGGSILAGPLAAGAQPAGKTWRIGWLGDGNRAAREANTLTPLREGLDRTIRWFEANRHGGLVRL